MRAKKIFVEVGSHKMPFNRLLIELDSLVGNKKLSANVFAQTGYSTYKPKSFKSKKFLSEKEFISRVKWGDLVVSHGGAGNIITALSMGKPLVVVPRRKKFYEHTDDHQAELAKALEKKGRAQAVYKTGELLEAIRKSGKKKKVDRERNELIKKIEKFIREIEGN